MGKVVSPSPMVNSNLHAQQLQQQKLNYQQRSNQMPNYPAGSVQGQLNRQI
jgi:hypothetical protein